MLGEEYKLRSSSVCSFLHHPVNSSHFRPFLRQRLCSFPNVKDQVSHPYRITGKIIILCILIFLPSDSRRKDKRFSNEWEQAIPECNLFLVSSWINFDLLLSSSKMFKQWRILKHPVFYPYLMTLPCIQVTRSNMHLIFFTFISRPAYLREPIKVSVFFLVASIFKAHVKDPNFWSWNVPIRLALTNADYEWVPLSFQTLERNTHISKWTNGIPRNTHFYFRGLPTRVTPMKS
jgi:hypothetical protein